MRVNIQESHDGPVVSANVDLAECYPDDPDGYAAALAELNTSGFYVEGGGAAAVSYLRRTEDHGTNGSLAR